MFEIYSNDDSERKKYENTRKCSFIKILCLQLFVYFQNNYASVKQKEDGTICIKSYYCLLEESKGNTNFYEEYRNEIEKFVLSKDSTQNSLFLRPSNDQEKPLWFFKITYEYWRKQDNDALLSESAFPSDLKFKSFDELIKCLEEITHSYRNRLQHFQSYKLFSEKMEKEQMLIASDELNAFISMQLRLSRRRNADPNIMSVD